MGHSVLAYICQDAAINFLGGSLKMMGMSLNGDIVSQLKVIQGYIFENIKREETMEMGQEIAQ